MCKFDRISTSEQKISPISHNEDRSEEDGEWTSSEIEKFVDVPQGISLVEKRLAKARCQSIVYTFAENEKEQLDSDNRHMQEFMLGVISPVFYFLPHLTGDTLPCIFSSSSKRSLHISIIHTKIWDTEMNVFSPFSSQCSIMALRKLCPIEIILKKCFYHSIRKKNLLLFFPFKL